MSDISALLTKELFFFHKTPLLPSSPVSLLSPCLALKVRWEMREQHRHLYPTGSNRPWEEQPWWCVGCGPPSMPSEEECLVMATQWVLPSAERVCALLARGPFPSSLVSSQINLLWSEHTLTRPLYATTAALRCTAASRQARLGISSCMHAKKKRNSESNGWFIIEGNFLSALTEVHSASQFRVD